MTTPNHHPHDAIAFTTSDERISALLQQARETDDLEGLLALAYWDQQTAMPAGASEVKMHQTAALEGLLHQRQSAPQLGALLQKLEDVIEQPGFTDTDRGLVWRMRRAYDQATKLPAELVQEQARVGVASFEAWTKARQQKDFATFAPWLQRTLDLQREVADHLGFAETRYDALIDLREPGLTAREMERLFTPVRDVSTTLLRRIQASGKNVDTSCLQGPFPIEQQKTLIHRLAASVGYNFTHGQIAHSTHPFTTSFGSPLDVRFTIRPYNEQKLQLMVALHEGGHALYEQGVSPNLLRTLLAHGTSSGVHESQSRLWENALGRSEPFWRGKYNLVREAFPQQFQDVDVTTFVRALNQVQPGLIRVDADEVTYNLHIIIRFELEKALVNGEIAIETLPSLWRAKYREYLGIEPEDDLVGTLQDAHWTGGFGGFQGYTLGNLYAAQIFHRLHAEFADFDDRLATGDTAFVLQWLREHMYACGSIYVPHTLIERVTGEAPDPRYFASYLTEKFEKIYEL